jgi:hypothetical protein
VCVYILKWASVYDTRSFNSAESPAQFSVEWLHGRCPQGEQPAPTRYRDEECFETQSGKHPTKASQFANANQK